MSTKKRVATLIKQRVMQIAAGFEDADHCYRLRNDKDENFIILNSATL